MPNVVLSKLNSSRLREMLGLQVYIEIWRISGRHWPNSLNEAAFN